MRFIREIISIFGVKSLVKRRPLAKLTMRNLWAAEENVLVLYETDFPGDLSIRCSMYNRNVRLDQVDQEIHPKPVARLAKA